ncbi:mitotic-spindle organizing protein 1 [Teleopsis dalmanni]|uniref:mitotic-spindle organizing protein 1 n=1 Tax=Teleopsis dalmanni TaxID=139649 RepID=UPI0018CE7BC8|nr:mitotic-spindle organizing protein 1 [Teleopsis dalmanni]
MSFNEGTTDHGELKPPKGSNYLKLHQSQVIHNSIHGISMLLNTGLNEESLDICVKLIEAGVHPQALAEVICQIRREVSLLNTSS